MDSLTKIGEAKFQILASKPKGDTIFWQIAFIKELPSIRSKWINKKNPVSEFVDWQGNRIGPAELKNKVLFINCWSIHCAPCIKEMPYLNKLTDSLGKENFAFLAITFDKTDDIKDFFRSEKLKKFLNDPNPVFNFSIIPNQTELLDNVLGVINYPTTFVVDKQGVIVEMIEGVNLDEKKNPKVYTELMEMIKKVK